MSSTATPTSTKQTATGRATFRSVHGEYELMLWTSANAGGPICFGTCKTGSSAPDMQKSGVSAQTGTGPAFVLMPSGTTGYLVWVNTSQQIMVSQATATAKTPPKWSLAGKTLTITASKAAAGPTAALQIQNGQLVLTIVWQDLNAGSMVFTQIPAGTISAQTQPPFAQLGASCKDAPSLVQTGSVSHLAYTDTTGAFNLATDPASGVNFDFDRRFTEPSVNSAYGPAFVPLGSGQGYVVWGTSNGLNYQQMGINSDGDWQLNAREGCSGVLAGIVPTAAPSAQAVSVINTAGETERTILVAAPTSSAGTVLVAGIVPDLSPLPLPQLQLVTS